MATTAPVNFDVNYLRSQVVATYDRVAREPNAHCHFHRGPDYARDFLGLGSPLNRSKLMRWITLLPAFTILVPWASFRAGSGPMRTAWTTWSGCVGRMVSSARAAATMEAGGSAMVGSCARGAVAVRR